MEDSMWEGAWWGLAGGALIGMSAGTLWTYCGRVAGISGIVGGLWGKQAGGRGWRWSFVAGMLLGGWLMVWLPKGWGNAFLSRGAGAFDHQRDAAWTFFGVSPASWPLLVMAAMLVGVGTQIGNGCTSGHGVCGLARGARRSLVATGVFMAAGIVTVWIGGLL